MKSVRNFFHNLISNPKTSALGISGLVAIGFAASSNPAILAEPGVITTILSSAGLLVAADQSNQSK